jgi:hypothetical protein
LTSANTNPYIVDDPGVTAQTDIRELREEIRTPDQATMKSNFLCNIGTADETVLFQRLPRFGFEDVCKFA